MSRSITALMKEDKKYDFNPKQRNEGVFNITSILL